MKEKIREILNKFYPRDLMSVICYDWTTWQPDLATEASAEIEKEYNSRCCGNCKNIKDYAHIELNPFCTAHGFDMSRAGMEKQKCNQWEGK